MDVDSDSEIKNAILTDNSNDEGKGGSEGEGNGGNEGEGNGGSEGKGNGDKDGAQDSDGEDEVQSWNGKGKGKGKAKEATGKKRSMPQSDGKKTGKGGYDATNHSILPLKVLGFMQIKG